MRVLSLHSSCPCLPPPAGVEVACNILDPTTTPPEAVEARVAALAAAAGGEVAGSYRIGKSSEELRALAEGL